MDTVITFTPAQLVAICAAIITISGALGVIMKMIHAMNEPNKKQDERIEHIEKRMDELDDLIKNEHAKIEVMEKGNVVTQRAILALLSHGLDGNNVDEMKKARDGLNEYLIGKV